MCRFRRDIENGDFTSLFDKQFNSGGPNSFGSAGTRQIDGLTPGGSNLEEHEAIAVLTSKRVDSGGLGRW